MVKIGFLTAVLSFYVVFLAASGVFPQSTEHEKFQNFTESDGLPSNLIAFTLRDSKGFIWVGTSRGITRFDGINFRRFESTDFISPAKQIHFAYSAFELNDTCLIFLDQNQALTYYNYNTGKFHSLFTSDSVYIRAITPRYNQPGFIAVTGNTIRYFNKEGRAEQTVSLTKEDDGSPFSDRFALAVEDKEQNLWLPTAGDNLYIYVKKSGRLKKIPHYTFNRINEIAVSPDGSRIFITSYSGGLLIYDAKTNQFVKSIRPVSRLKKSFMPIPTAIYPESDTYLWLGTLSGLYRINLQSGAYLEYINYPGISSSLKENNITHIYGGAGSNLWIGTVGGLSRYSLNAKYPSLYKHDPEDIHSIANNTVNFIQRISARHIIYGTEKGLSIRDDITGRFYHYSIPAASEAGVEPIAIVLYRDKSGNYWLGTWGGRVFRLKFSGLSEIKPSVQFMPVESLNTAFKKVIYAKVFREDETGNLYLSTWGGGIIKIRQGKKTAQNPQFEVFDKANSNLPGNHFADLISFGDTLILASGFGLCIFDTQSKKSDVFKFKPDEPESPFNGITYILPYAGSRFLVGTYGGPILYNPHNNTAETFPSSYSYHDNTSLQAAFDSKGRLWYNKSHSKIVIYDTASRNERVVDLLQDFEGFYFSFGTAFVDYNNEVYFAGYTGALKIPGDIKRFNTEPPPVRITGISILNEKYQTESDYSLVQSVTLNYPAQDFSISYAALNYNNSVYNRYKYRLTGYDQNWIDAGGRREAIYTNIPYGEYVFTVIGCNNEGVWNNTGTQLTIIVVPPFWATLWFQVLIASLSGGLLLWFILRRIRVLEMAKRQQEEFTKKLIETQEQERKRIASELHDGLGQNLLVIKNMIQLLPSPQEFAEDHAELQQLVTDTIDDTRNLSGRLHPHQLDSLGLAKTLQALFRKIGKVHKLQIDAQIQDSPASFSKEHEITIYRVVQEALNNIVKHSKADTVSVSLLFNQQNITLSIADNGRGFDIHSPGMTEKLASGFGLKSMHERIKLLDGEFSVTSIPESGTTIKIILPL